MSEDIRSTVSVAYAEALERAQNKAGSCCDPGPTATAAKLAGYTEEIASFADAAGASFGCGNPLAFAGVERGQTVVDLGSGAGLDLLIASDKVGPEGAVIGIDMTSEMLDAARNNASAAGKTNIEVREGYIENLPIADATVDWVISNCVINLSPEKPAVFREIARVLAPGGRFAISDIVVEELPPWIRASAAAYSACVAGAIGEAEYLDGLREAGLVDVEVTERLVYDADQLRGLLTDDLGSLELPESVIERGIAEVAGKVWSARIVGRKPASVAAE